MHINVFYMELMRCERLECYMAIGLQEGRWRAFTIRESRSRLFFCTSNQIFRFYYKFNHYCSSEHPEILSPKENEKMLQGEKVL
jgi:hypothetical protein